MDYNKFTQKSLEAVNSAAQNAKENGSIPVYSNINKNTEPNAPELPVLDVDIRSADIFSMICGRPAAEFSDKVQVPKML